MCATGEEVGASRSENGIGEESRKDKTCVGSDRLEATTYSALTVECCICQKGAQRFTAVINDSLYGMGSIVNLVAVEVPQLQT